MKIASGEILKETEKKILEDLKSIEIKVSEIEQKWQYC